MSSPSTASASVSVVIAGASGTLGLALLKALSDPRYASKFKLFVLQRNRAASEPAKPSRSAAEALIAERSIGTLNADLASVSVAELSALLRSVNAHTIVSVLSPPLLLDGQSKLIEASQAAQVRRFVPSEFGFDLDAVPAGQISFVDEKLKIRELLTKSGLRQIRVSTGVFLEYALSPFIGVDAATRTLRVPHNEAVQFNTTSIEDIAEFSAEFLAQDDPNGPPQPVNIRLSGELISYRRLFELLNQHSGAGSWKQEIISKQQTEGAIAANPHDFVAKFQLLIPELQSHNYARGWNDEHSKRKAESVEHAIKRLIK